MQCEYEGCEETGEPHYCHEHLWRFPDPLRELLRQPRTPEQLAQAAHWLAAVDRRDWNALPTDGLWRIMRRYSDKADRIAARW